MGYREKKLIVENKYKILKRVLLGIFLLIFAGVAVFSVFVPPTTWKYYVALPEVSKCKAGEMRIHFLDVGQGDCSVVELPDGKVMMIDGGKDSPSTEKKILRYLNALKIETIDYLVVSHADEDHCGGLDAVLEYKKVLNAYLPPSSTENNSAYAEFYARLLKENCEWRYSSRALKKLGNSESGYPYTLSFLYPYADDVDALTESETELDEKQENAYCSVLWLDYFGTSILFTGDAPKNTEEALMRDDKNGYFGNRGVDLASTEILKVAHHGSADSTSGEFLSYLGVETAVISCGAGNIYRHPTRAVLENLQSRNTRIYRTDTQGNIMITLSPDGTYAVTTI